MRCPECGGITGYRRKTKTPEWRCRKCRHEWDLDADEKLRWQSEQFKRRFSLIAANRMNICLCPNCGVGNRKLGEWPNLKFLCKECEYSWEGIAIGLDDIGSERGVCPECGKRLEIKSNAESGVSYRCTGYPECEYVRHRWKILQEHGFPDEIEKREQEALRSYEAFAKEYDADKELPYSRQQWWHPSDKGYEDEWDRKREQQNKEYKESVIKFLLGAVVMIFLFYSCFIYDSPPQPYEEKPYDCYGRGCSGD